MLSPMKKRVNAQDKYTLPKLPSLNHSTLANSSPSDSFTVNNSFNKTNKPRVPRLVCKPHVTPLASRPNSQNPVDNEFFDEYR